MIVFKFGGKSLASKEKVKNICKYIAERSKEEKLIVVVSAFGNETDRLCEEFERYGGLGNTREKDMLLSTGETKAAALVATMLQTMNVKAASFQAYQAKIFAMGAYGNAVITEVETEFLRDQLKEYDVLVITGFQAINKKGETVTIGRNGSDASAVAIASSIGCPVEIYSDFDGLFCGDPRNFNYKKIDNIDYKSLEQIADCGSKVLSRGSALMAEKNKTPLTLKSSKNPNKSGTVVSECCDKSICISKTDKLSRISIIFIKNTEKINKTAEYIIKNVKYSSFFVKNNVIELFVEEKNGLKIEKEIALFNHLLEE